ncbi:MAG: type II secretion system F family protein [Gaiellaceae bacterium]
MRRLSLAALVALAFAAPAAGAVQISSLDTSAYPQVRLSVVASRPVSTLPTLTENGQPVTDLTGVNLSNGASVVLAVDRSESMAGASLRNATAAGQAFVDQKPGADRIAVVAFGRHAETLGGFSPAAADADATLRGVTVDTRPGTALYDGVVAAAGLLGRNGTAGRVIILLTDGHDVSSSATLADAVAAARAAHAAIYPIAIASHDFDPVPLQQLALQTNGTYHRATSSAALRSVYASIADELARTWQVSYVTAARPGDRVALVATTPAGTARTSLAIPAGYGSGPQASPSALLPSPLYSTGGTIAFALLIGLIVLVAGLFVMVGARGSWVKTRLAPHIGERERRIMRRKERLSLLAALYKATESAFGGWRRWASLEKKLERGDIPLRPAEFIWASVGLGLAFGVVAAILGLSALLILALLALGGAIPYMVVSFRVRRRARAFEDQLPEILTTIAATLKAGHSFKQGMQAVVDEGHPPASEELKRVLAETGLGRPMDDALEDMAERTGSENFSFAITAVTIQRQVGGARAGRVDLVADTVRQRQQFARKIRGLTAMGRMSAYVLVGLPFFIALAITITNPGYMSPLYHTGAGHVLIIGGLLMMGIGALILNKIVSFKG